MSFYYSWAVQGNCHFEFHFLGMKGNRFHIFVCSLSVLSKHFVTKLTVGNSICDGSLVFLCALNRVDQVVLLTIIFALDRFTHVTFIVLSIIVLRVVVYAHHLTLLFCLLFFQAHVPLMPKSDVCANGHFFHVHCLRTVAHEYYYSTYFKANVW